MITRKKVSTTGALLAASLLCACADKLTPPEDLVLILPDGTAVYRVENTPPERLQLEREKEAVVVPAGMAGNLPAKAYPIARYVDPFNPNLMHERHVIYRSEKLPQWYLDADASRQILIGPTVGGDPLSLRPAVLNAELAQELSKTRGASVLMLKGTEDLINKSEALIAEAARLAEVNAQLSAQAAAEEARRRRAEQAVERLKTENDQLKAPKAYEGDMDE
jgi:hypothetical protein